MNVRRAVIVDRDPTLLARLMSELNDAGVAVEALSSTVGLTPDLLLLSEPDVLVLDAELPGLETPAMQVIIRSMQAHRPVKVMLTSEREPGPWSNRLGLERFVPRQTLLVEGSSAFGFQGEAGGGLDVRALLDEVLAELAPSASGAATQLEVQVDLFSKSNFYISSKDVLGVFVATQSLPAVGQRVSIQVNVLDKQRLALQGQVAWQRQKSIFGGKMSAGVGVRFVDLSADQTAAIKRFFEFREPLVWMG